jgi:DNA-binding transcriptional LysR family regulator
MGYSGAKFHLRRVAIMMDWDKLRIFHAVATAQSFTRAGEMLNVSQSAISRQISTLEEDLKVALFHRHARGLLLTEQGEILLKTVNDVFARLTTVENALMESKDRPHGPLKITAPTAIGTMWLTPHMKEFCDLYPDIEVTLLADDRELDLTKREADVAIRLFPATHPDLVQKKLITLNNSLYAASDYINKFGLPAKPEDLAKHRLIAYAGKDQLPFDDINWVLKCIGSGKPCNCKPFFTINSMRGMLRAMKSGMGIAGLPDYMVQGSQKVIHVLPELKGPVTDMYLVYSVDLRNSKRVHVFKEFLIRKLAEDGLSNAA